MKQGTRRGTYNTVIARKLLDKHLPEHLREERAALPAPATTAAGQCFRRVTEILEGKHRPVMPAEWRP